MSKHPKIPKRPSGKVAYLAAAQELIDELSSEESNAIMTTTDSLGRPQATWMGTIKTRFFESVVTLTSPESREVQNVISNPLVEWMFSDSRKYRIVYLRGRAEIVHDPEKVATILTEIGSLSQAYFLSHHPIGMEFIVIETHIDEVEYCSPRENIFAAFALSTLTEYLETASRNGPSSKRDTASKQVFA